MHKELLALPWRDVFTTNYDRLLERTCILIPERPYELVLTRDDLSVKQSPRIVKLHGSFPSHRPYIFTLEDYRKYPRDHAPFVNLAQEAIIENAFCLIGFSGDDPNFLQWSGWVRDHLGKAAPPIYLCDVLDLGASQQRFFQSMGITPIDLGPLFPLKECPREERHARATEWLLRSLHNGKPLERIWWPNPARLIDRGPLSFDEPIPLESAKPNSSKESPDSNDKPTLGDLRELIASWRNQRQEYPDWVVIPEKTEQRYAIIWNHGSFRSVYLTN